MAFQLRSTVTQAWAAMATGRQVGQILHRPGAPARRLGARDAWGDLALRAVLIVRDETDCEYRHSSGDVERADSAFSTGEVQGEGCDDEQECRQVVTGG